MIVGNLSGESFIIALSGLVIVFIMLGLLALLVVVMSKLVRSVSKDAPKQAAPAQPIPAPAAAPIAAEPAVDPFEAPVQIELTGVDDLTAACIIAIVSDEIGVSPDDLIFKSIKAL